MNYANNKNENQLEDSSSLANSNSNIQRSSSHESYSRNKITQNSIPQPATPQIEQKYLTTNSAATSNSPNKSYLFSNNSLNNINESYQGSPNDPFSLGNNKNSCENIRRCSTEGSEYSSKCPSGQASPSLQSPTRSYINKQGLSLLIIRHISSIVCL